MLLQGVCIGQGLPILCGPDVPLKMNLKSAGLWEADNSPHKDITNINNVLMKKINQKN